MRTHPTRLSIFRRSVSRRFDFRRIGRRKRSPSTALFLALLASSFATGATALASTSVADSVRESISLDDLGLRLALPPLDDLLEGRRGKQIRARWDGTIGDSRCSIQLRLLPNSEFSIEEPDGVTHIGIDHLRSRLATAESSIVLRAVEALDGDFGHASYASLAHAVRTEQSGTLQQATSEHLILGFVLPDHGCALEVTSAPPPSESDSAKLRDYLRDAVHYSGPMRNVEWSKDEVRQRWDLHAPETARRDSRKPIRTKHYLIMTNSSGGKLFAKKMEANYKKIQKLYPFPEIPGRRLMPVYLFRSNHEYYAFCESMAGWSKSKAAASKGHAWKDYYATWYESPNDPVHIHEATHQIFANRLRLNGGGSWFQEGVAEYIESSKNSRNVAARLVAEEKATGLRDFMSLRSLLYSSGSDQRTGNKAHDHYSQAGLFTEFLHKSRFGKKKFQEYLHAVGAVPRADIEALEAAIRSVYGVGIDELEVEFQRYCKNR